MAFSETCTGGDTSYVVNWFICQQTSDDTKAHKMFDIDLVQADGARSALL